MTQDTLKSLWEEARLYGMVDLYTNPSGKYWCQIEFNTITHVVLKAQSQFNCVTPEEALMEAIAKAKEIVRSTAPEMERLKQLSGSSTRPRPGL